MATTSYAKRVSDAQVMADGIKEMKDNLPLGVQESDSEKLIALKKEVESLNSQQESLKAELKKLTQTLNAKEDELDKLHSNLKKRIKLDIDQSLWKKFGIEDKK